MANQDLGTLILRLKADISDLKKGLSDGTKAIKESTDIQKKQTETLGQSIAGIRAEYVKFAAAAFAAGMVIKKAFDWAELGAKAEAVHDSFAAVTESVGADADKLVAGIKSASAVYVDETELMVMANKLLAEGVSATDIPKLFEAARVAARLMGTDVNQAMELVTRAVLTFQTRGLFRQAFPMESEKVFEAYAGSINKDVDMLSTFAKQQAMVNKILEMAAEKMAVLGGPLMLNHYENLQRLSSGWQEFKERLGGLVLDIIDPFLKLSELISDLSEKFPKLSAEIRATVSNLPGVGLLLEKLVYGGPKTRPELKLPAVAGTPGTEGITKEKQQKALVDEDKLQKALTKLRLDAEKARIDAEGQLRIFGLEAQHNKVLTEAARIGQDTFEIDLIFAKKKADIELQNILASLKAQEAAEVANAISDKKTREIPAIKEKIRQQERIAEGKYRDEITKLDLEEVKKRNERKLALDDAATKTEISNQQAVLDQAQDYYDRLLISAKAFYKIKEDVTIATGTSEIRMLQERLNMETDEAKKADFRAQIIERTNKLEKDLTANRWDAYKALQSEIELHKQILETDISRQNIAIDMAREKFEITEADALKQRIQLQKNLLSALQDQLSLTDKISDPKKYADIQLAMAQTTAQIQTMNIALTEQTGNLAQLTDIGMKRYADGVKKNIVSTTENLIPNAFDTAGNSFKTFINDLVDGTTSAKEALHKMFDNMARDTFNMLIDIGMLIVKMEILKALGYGSSAGTAKTGVGGTGGGTNLLSTAVSLIGSFLQTGGPVAGPSGSDRVPIMATAGEFVVQQSAVRKYGSGFMAMINEGMLDISRLTGARARSQSMMAFAGGGPVTPSSSGQKDKSGDITIYNVIDPRDMDKWAASSGGQNAILNVLSSRAVTVRKIVR
jgi:hypothetical protein